MADPLPRRPYRVPSIRYDEIHNLFPTVSTVFERIAQNAIERALKRISPEGRTADESMLGGEEAP